MPEPAAIGYQGTKARNVMDEHSLWHLARHSPRLLGRFLAMAWQADRCAVIVLLVAEVVGGAASGVLLAMTAQAMAPLVGTGTVAHRVHEAMPYLIGAGVSAAVSRGSHAFGQWAEDRLRPQLLTAADQSLLDAVLRVRLEVYQNPEFTQDQERAEAGVVRSERLVTEIQVFLGSLIRLVAAGGVLAGLHPLMLGVLLLAVVPSGVGAVLRARIEYRTSLTVTAGRTIKSMMRGYATSKWVGDEVRGNSMGPYLRFWYARISASVDEKILAETPKQLRVDLLSYATSGLCLAGAYGALGWLTVTGRVSLAVSATVIVAVRQALASIRDLLAYTIGLFRHCLYLADWEKFIDNSRTQAPRTTGPVVPEAVETVRAEKVSYWYPNKTAPAVDDVSLTFNRGEVVAIVGENGSGKSTLIRLLLGLYTTEKGTVTWDGIDLRDADQVALRDRTGVVTQAFCSWPLSVRENVTLGQPRTHDDVPVWEALNQVGMVEAIEELPNRLDTLLARELYGGVLLSGGQWQRIACARAMYRQPALLVMDEPTSMMDARGEHQIFTELKKMAQGRITIVVTHRLENTKIADRIVVMEHGKVIEHGTFGQLATAGGLFQELYELSQDR
ncbi:ABC transporter ATP-binding protein [Streptomyces gamaensis]|uniref:ABC transporter ATP-binding protein n=1 Tax=Streptomyces gamaensis TaxID=1763542 RepID=A0ABW0YW82_9ACTN